MSAMSTVQTACGSNLGSDSNLFDILCSVQDTDVPISSKLKRSASDQLEYCPVKRAKYRAEYIMKRDFKRQTIHTAKSIQEKLEASFNSAKDANHPREFYRVFRKAVIGYLSDQTVQDIQTEAGKKGLVLLSNGTPQRSRIWLQCDKWSNSYANDLVFPKLLRDALMTSDDNGGHITRNYLAKSNAVCMCGPDGIVNKGIQDQNQKPHSDMGKSKHWETADQDLSKITFRQSGSLLISVTDSDICVRRYVNNKPRYQKLVLQQGDAIFMSSHQVHYGTGTKAVKLFYSYSVGGYIYNAQTDQQWFPQYATTATTVDSNSAP